MYSSVTDVRNAVAPGLISRESPASAGSLNEDQITDAILEADSIVDLHVRGRYQVVMSTTDPTVAVAPFRWWSRNIAAWNATMSLRQTKPIDENDPVRLRYQQTMEALLAVKDGNLDIPDGVPADTAAAGDEVFVYNQYIGTLFGPGDFGLAPSAGSERPLVWGGNSWLGT